MSISSCNWVCPACDANLSKGQFHTTGCVYSIPPGAFVPIGVVEISGALTSSATICGCCGADRSKGQLHTFKCSNRCVGEMYAGHPIAHRRVNAYGVADKDAAMASLDHTIKLELDAAFVKDLAINMTRSFGEFLTSRAAELRAKANAANIFDGKRVELLCAANEMDKAARDFAATIAAS